MASDFKLVLSKWAAARIKAEQATSVAGKARADAELNAAFRELVTALLRPEVTEQDMADLRRLEGWTVDSINVSKMRSGGRTKESGK